MPGAGLSRQVVEVTIEVDLHGVATRSHEATPHLLALDLGAATHLDRIRQFVVARQVAGEQAALRFDQRHDRAEGLSEAREHQAPVLQMKAPQK